MKKIKLLMLMYMLGIVSNIYAQTNPKTDYTYTFTGTNFNQAVMDEIETNALAISGIDPENYTVAVVFPAGNVVNMIEENSSVVVPAGMSVFFFGNEGSTKATINLPRILNVKGKHTAISFENVNLIEPEASNSSYVINQPDAASSCNISWLRFANCFISNFGRGLVRHRYGNIDNIEISDCIVTGTNDYSLIQQEAAGFGTIEIDGSTFYNISTNLIVDKTPSNDLESISITNSTFYNCFMTGKYWIDLKNMNTAMAWVVIDKVLVGHLNPVTSEDKCGKGIRAQASRVTVNNLYETNDVKWGGASDYVKKFAPGVTFLEWNSDELFANPAENDFTLKHYLDAGDPRWKTEGESIAIDETNFPDENFRSYLLSQEYGVDAVLTEKEILSIPTLNLSGMQIQNLKGIEYFTELNSLICSNNQLSTLDISQNWKLKFLYCAQNKLSSLDLSNNSLKILQCGNNEFTTLDLRNQESLYYLDCAGNKLKSLDVSECPLLRTIRCDQNYISGEGMQNLINSLPVNKGNLRIYYNENDNNIITRAQVETAKGKDWTVYCSNGSEWIEYEGSDIVIVEDYEEPVATIADEEYYSLDLSSSDVAYADMVSVNETGKGRITIVDEGLQFSQGENINLALSDLQNGKIIKFTFTGSMRCASGKLIASNAQSYSFPFVTDAMMEIESDTEYSIAEDGNLVIEMETTESPVELKSITITEPTGVNIVETSTSNPSSCKTYNLAGQQINANSNGLLIQGDKKIIKH